MRKMRGQADRQKPDLGRRGLFTGSFFTREGRENIKQQQQLQQNPLGSRPPWHQQVMDDCSHCKQECAVACPQGIIRLHDDEHDHASTPWLNFSTTGCTFCGDCAVACPSLESYEQKSSQIGDLQLTKINCLTWNAVFCMSCIGKCEVRALQLDERRRLVLDERLCTGCGMCVHACPVDALVIQAN